MLVTPLVLAAYVSVGIALIAGNLMLVDIGVCFFAASDEWTEQWFEGNVVGIDSVHVRYAIELCAMGALNILASIVFLLRRSGWGWWFVIGMQVGIFMFAEIEALVIDPNAPGWSTFSRFPLVIVFLLLAIQIAQRRLKSALIAR